MKKISKTEIIKALTDYLIKNKRRLNSIDFKFPGYKPIMFRRDGTCEEEAIIEEIITLNLKPQFRRIR